MSGFKDSILVIGTVPIRSGHMKCFIIIIIIIIIIITVIINLILVDELNIYVYIKW